VAYPCMCVFCGRKEEPLHNHVCNNCLTKANSLGTIRELQEKSRVLLEALEAAHGYLVMMGTDHADHVRKITRSAILQAKGQ
jgi:hypothetical protein